MSTERPTLALDLQGPDGNVFIVIIRARALLTGLMLEHFNTEIGEATLINIGTSYKDILAIVNKYVRLVDTSGLYAEYAVNQEEIIAAITRFNEQLQTLPPTVVCAIDGLYPEFDNKELGPEVYLCLVEDEIRWTLSILARNKDEGYERLLTMLRECASALKRAGIESVV